MTPASKIPGLLKKASQLAASGQPAAAADIFRQVLASFPARAEANHGLLNVLLDSRQWEQAEQAAARWAGFDSKAAPAWMGMAVSRLQQGKDAIEAATMATATNRSSAEAYEYLGLALKRAGRLNEAIESYRKAIKLKPSSVNALINMGNALGDAGLVAQATEHFARALAIEPRHVHALFNLGVAYSSLGDFPPAKDNFLKVLALAPNFAEAHTGIGVVYKQEQDLDAAETSLRTALRLAPTLADAHYNLGIVLHDKGLTEEGKREIDRAIELAPTNGMFRAASIYATLPFVAADERESQAALIAFDEEIERYGQWRQQLASNHTPIAFDTVVTLPFLLAYRPGNHVQRMSRFADVVKPQQPPLEPAVREPSTKIKIGIVSSHIRRHSVWNINIKGLVRHLDRTKFVLTLYSLGSIKDDETRFAREHADRWIDSTEIQGSVGWSKRIAADGQDVLLYPEIGMDPVTYLLASQRLAPLQVAAWGHPMTSGLPTIDWYCSGEAFEQAGSQAQYREQLKPLPGCGCCTDPLDDEAAPIPEVEQRIAQEGPLVLFPHMPFKVDPSCDALFADALAAIGRCTLVIPRDRKVGHATDKLVHRLQAALDAKGADCRIAVVDWMRQAEFRTLLRKTAVYLDCPSFSGYTTAWMAAREGTPIVTIKGPTLRQALAAGLLEQIGVTETIAHDAPGYVRLASEIAQSGIEGNAGLRQRLRDASHLADGRVEVVRQLEALIIDYVKSS